MRGRDWVSIVVLVLTLVQCRSSGDLEYFVGEWVSEDRRPDEQLSALVVQATRRSVRINGRVCGQAGGCEWIENNAHVYTGSPVTPIAGARVLTVTLETASASFFLLIERAAGGRLQVLLLVQDSGDAGHRNRAFDHVFVRKG